MEWIVRYRWGAINGLVAVEAESEDEARARAFDTDVVPFIEWDGEPDIREGARVESARPAQKAAGDGGEGTEGADGLRSTEGTEGT